MSSLLTLIFLVLAAVKLFLHGLAAFSEENTWLGGERLRKSLRCLVHTDWRGALAGAFVTAVVQSSSTVTSMVVELSHNRTRTECGAFAVMIGVNMDTRLAAWLRSTGSVVPYQFNSVSRFALAVSLRLRPRLDLQPAMLEIQLRLPEEAPRIFLASILNLLPGTLSADLDGNRLYLHVLDQHMPIEQEVRNAEARVARLFRTELT